MIVLYVFALLLCFFLLAKVCEQYFVQSLDLIAHKLRLSEDVAGATLMAMGSSAPELFTAMIALTRAGAENVGAGTIVGSAIFNVLVIVGASAAVATAYLDWRPVIRDLLFYIFSIVILLITFSDGVITGGEALLYIFGYALYLGILANWRKWVTQPDQKHPHIPKKNRALPQKELRESTFILKMEKVVDHILGPIMPDLRKHPEYYIRVFCISILLIGAISWCLVELAVLLSHAIGISEVIIALTVLAAGTSVPDLLSSIIVAKQGRGGMAVSNAVGSNTFDILVGLGFPWMLYILFTGQSVMVSTENLLSSILLLFFTVIALLLLLAMQKFKIGQKSGYLLLVLYLCYIVFAIYGN